MPIVTNHGKRRMSERNGVQKGCAKKIAKRAYQHGISHNEAANDLKRFMDKMFLSRRNVNKIMFYGKSLYLFHYDVLVTTIIVPDNIANNIKCNVTEDGYKRYNNYKESLKNKNK